MKWILDKTMENQDKRAKQEFFKRKEEWENERGGYLRGLINEVEKLFKNEIRKTISKL